MKEREEFKLERENQAGKDLVKKKRRNDLILFILLIIIFFPTLATWWTNGTQITPSPSFWGDDWLSQAFQWIANNLFIPVWNALASNIALRAFVTVVLTGFLSKLGSDLYKLYFGDEKEKE